MDTKKHQWARKCLLDNSIQCGRWTLFPQGVTFGQFGPILFSLGTSFGRFFFHPTLLLDTSFFARRFFSTLFSLGTSFGRFFCDGRFFEFFTRHFFWILLIGTSFGHFFAQGNSFRVLDMTFAHRSHS